MLKYFAAFLFLSLGSLSAQTFTGRINPFPRNNPQVLFADSLKILAVMVNFQEDKDASTFGNGKFGTIYSKDYGKTILDPLPHDRSFFEAHLEFAKNYFMKVSNGNLNISYTVLPDTFSVSGPMRNYSPTTNSTDFTLLADFSKEVWEKADQQYPGFDFSSYDIFIVFHAGVGRDISLPGSLGNERDLPSVYLGENSLKKIYGNAFSGFPVSGGTFNITNTVIIPETESRELSSFGSTVLFEITINGLIAASIGSHLGLPDLFDTKTGLSAIGRLGLMDGQAIFAYNGLFPPEPSAWEKIKLGWEFPVTVFLQDALLTLTTKEAALFGDTTILKVPINSSEYYLIENRNRDAKNDGATLTLINNGLISNKTFLKDQDGFYSFAVDSVDGMLLNVDEYDWAIPGFIDDTANYKGGIVIWHIDENIINSRIASNEINTDKNLRGVDVEEADGIQDIGERFQTIFGDVVIGEGTYEDFWYTPHPAKLFRNRFDKNSRPNTMSNTGANSLISLFNFSAIGNKMTFNISFGDSVIEPVISTELPMLSEFVNITSGTSGEKFYIRSENNLYIMSLNGIMTNQFSPFSNFKPAVLATGGTEYLIGSSDSLVNILVAGTFIKSVNIGNTVSTPPVIYTVNNENMIAVGTYSSTGWSVKTFIFNPADTAFLIPSETFSSSGNVTNISADNGYLVWTVPMLSEVTQVSDNNNQTYTIPGVVNQLALTKNRNGNYIVVALANNNSFYILSGGSLIRKIDIKTSTSSFALSDLKNDSENYIIYNSGNSIHSINLAGAEAEGFPFNDPLGKNFTGNPLAADFEGDSRSEVIASTEDGRIFAIDGFSGRVVSGFPLSMGSGIKGTPSLLVNNGKATLVAIDKTNHISGWNIGSVPGTFYWSEEHGNNMNNSFTSTASASNYINLFFPKDKVYNYPNPVYGNETAIRYYVSENSKVNIKIFDLAGDFVAELNGDGSGGLENEVFWNVSNIQSGVYLARIEAAGVTGKTEHNIIKIAVVK